MIFSLIADVVKTGIGFWGETRKAKQARKIAEINNESRLLSDRESNNSKWEMANLNDKDKFIRAGAFIVATSTLWGYWISPELGARIQVGWNHLTPIQSDLLQVVLYSVFGIKKAQQFAGPIIKAFTDRVIKK